VVLVGVGVILGIIFYGDRPYTLATAIVGFGVIIVMLLIFRSYLGARELADKTFKIIPCRKGVIRKVGKHLVVCVRCFVVYVVTMVLTPLTVLSSYLGHNIWINFYFLVVNHYGMVAYAMLTLIFLLAVPIHGTTSVVLKKELDALRLVTSVLLSISLFLIYAFLTVTIFQ
jgi:hypothetical protein